jgi:uncharacterized protein with von Willebrand factor type A (vWA) domain
MTDGHLFYNLLLFGRLLRGLGLDVDSGRMIDLAQVLEHVQVSNRTDFYYTLRGLLVRRKADFALFDQAFELFWRKPLETGPGGLVRTGGEVRRSRRPVVVPPPLRLPPEMPLPPKDPARPSNPDEPPVIQATLTYSNREQLRRKDFSQVDESELAAIRQLLAQLAWQIGERRTRRVRPGGRESMDLRHMFRHNLRFGGEILEWDYRQPRYRPRPLIVLADISGSMERYTRLLLHFAYGISRDFTQGVETFVFSTRLTPITRALRQRDVDRALSQVSHSVPDWSGGTRIGEALKTFNFTWARRVLGRGAVVLLISDGWDTGDAGLLRREMARLQRSCYRLIWLNPLLGSADYEPLTRGMQAALPFIDDFLPVHNLASLEDLAAHLAQLGETRRLRRQTSP